MLDFVRRFHYRLIKKRFAAADRRTREGTRGFGVPDTLAGLRSYATRLGKRVCQNAFFHFCPHGLATDCNCRATAILPYIPPLHTRHLLSHFHCIARVSIISVGGNVSLVSKKSVAQASISEEITHFRGKRVNVFRKKLLLLIKQFLLLINV